MNKNVRTCEGVDGQPVIVGAWCWRCGREAMPMRGGRCGWCDLRILDEDAASPNTPKAAA